MKSVERLLFEVFSNPTAPYRENWVLEYVSEELTRLRIPFFRDSWGNIVAGTRNPASLRQSRKLALMAHTDHPGFHLEKQISSTRWRARWFGGAPPKLKGARLAIHDPRRPGEKVCGVFASQKLQQGTKRFIVEIPRHGGRLDSTCFGAFDFPAFKKKGKRIVTRAADDLTGVTIILATLARLGKKERKHCLGIFTRAEETGFRGALGILHKDLLGKNNVVISLEASRQLVGARLGKGPVIRLGDKRSLFDTSLTSQIDLAHQQLMKQNKKFIAQRRIMNGGTCEATPFNLYGIKASGLAIPLGNYHNERPDGRPGAEFIHLTDVEGAVDLSVRLFKNFSRGCNPLDDFKTDLRKGFLQDRNLLFRKIEFETRSP